MRLFVASDIHSYFEIMMSELTKAGFDINNPEHIFVSCGDLFDRGPHSQKMMEFVCSLPHNRKILVRGNHEDLMQDLLRRQFPYSHDFHNGTFDTVLQLCPDAEYFNSACDEIKQTGDWDKYFDSTLNYFEIDRYIFVHGWIPNSDDWRNCDYFDWKNEARWMNGMEMWSQGVREPNKTIVCGHWHTSWGHSVLHNVGVEWDDVPGCEEEMHTEPFVDDGIIALDACTAYSNKVNILVIDCNDTEEQQIKEYFESGSY